MFLLSNVKVQIQIARLLLTSSAHPPTSICWSLLFWVKSARNEWQKFAYQGWKWKWHLCWPRTKFRCGLKLWTCWTCWTLFKRFFSTKVKCGFSDFYLFQMPTFSFVFLLLGDEVLCYVFVPSVRHFFQVFLALLFTASLPIVVCFIWAFESDSNAIN